MSAVEVTATVRIQSPTLTVAQISALLGVEPTHWTHEGEALGSPDPDGPNRSIMTWDFSVVEYAEDPMTPAFERLRPLLVRLADVDTVDQRRDAVVVLHGREMGNWYSIGPEYVELIARAGAGLILDVYSTPEDETPI